MEIPIDFHDRAARCRNLAALFAIDSSAKLEKVGRAAPGAHAFCRLAVAGKSAEWPLTRKFGCSPERAAELPIAVRSGGLRPYGITFHFGSHQTNPAA